MALVNDDAYRYYRAFQLIAGNRCCACDGGTGVPDGGGFAGPAGGRPSARPRVRLGWCVHERAGVRRRRGDPLRGRRHQWPGGSRHRFQWDHPAHPLSSGGGSAGAGSRRQDRRFIGFRNDRVRGSLHDTAGRRPGRLARGGHHRSRESPLVSLPGRHGRHRDRRTGVVPGRGPAGAADGIPVRDECVRNWRKLRSTASRAPASTQNIGSHVGIDVCVECFRGAGACDPRIHRPRPGATPTRRPGMPRPG